MCFNVKKKKYTYLSMCSCCNVVSKYPSTVKKHLQIQHMKKHAVTGGELRIIPIRIENKFERVIRRSLDKTNFRGKLTAKQVNPLDDSLCLESNSRVVQNESNDKETYRRDKKTQKCTICNVHLSDLVTYLHHLCTVHVGTDKNISFSCPVCNAPFSVYVDLQNHIEKEHNVAISPISHDNCMNIETDKASLLHDQMQCPYCVLLFPELKLLKDHVRVLHSDYVETILIKSENDENVHEELAETDLTMYKCPSCEITFHTLIAVREHCLVEHTNAMAYRKPVRKRKPPKWLESEENDKAVKKQKTRDLDDTNTSKQSDRKFLENKAFVGKTKKDSGVERRNKCEYCRHVARTDSELLKHIKLKHLAGKQNQQSVREKSVRKVKDVKKKCAGRLINTKVTDVQSEDTGSQSLVLGLSESKKVKVESKSAMSEDEKEIKLHTQDNDFDLDENDSEPGFGDSDDDFVPEHSDGDSDESVKENSESLNCISCDKVFLSKRFLYAHMKKAHDSDLNFKTNQADKRGKQKKSGKVLAKELEGEEKYVTRYKCPFCEFYLYHYEYIRSHVQQSHPEVTNFRIYMREVVKFSSCEKNWESFKCPNPKCNVVCKKKNALQDHIAACAKGKFKNKTILCNLPKAWMEKLENTVSLMCPQCDAVVNGKKNYENHLRDHFPDKIFEVQLNSTLPPPQFSKPKNQNLRKAALKDLECSMCPYCELVTTQKAQLSKHFKRFHSNQSGSSVISCVLANQSSVKEAAKLIVKDAENVTSADVLESKAENETHNITEEVSLSAFGTVESKTELLSGRDIGYQKEWSKENEHVQTVYIQSTIPVATYMCPLCDDFKTHVKKDIKLHMDEHNSKTDEDIDSIFIIPDKWIKQEEKDRQFKCQFCNLSSHSNLTLGFRHVLNCHKDVTVDKPDQDLGPLFEMLTVNIEGVKEKYEREKYRCTTCVPGFVFKTKKGLQLHLKSHHTDRDSVAVYESLYQMMDLVIDSCDTRLIYMCCLCNKGIITKSELIDHFHFEHLESHGKLLDRLNKTTGGSAGTDDEQTKCEVCEKQFTDVKSLKHHLVLHVNRFKPTCVLCELCFTNRAELERHDMEVHFRSGEMCYKCGAMFPSTTALQRHVKTHDEAPRGVRRTLCQHCGTSVMAKNMKKHLVDKHIELVSCSCDICSKQQVPEWKKSVKCDLCEAVFCTWYNLRGHKHKKHNPEKKNMSFKCGRCHVIFSNRKDQVIHSHKCGKISDMSHTVDNSIEKDSSGSHLTMTKIAVTDDADIDFSRGLAYIRQKYIRFSKEAEKPYSCKLCPSTFIKASYVYNHLRRMHTRDEAKRLRCKVCKMGFMGKKEFEAHCRTHIGLRQYQCPVCHKRYKTPGHLKEHRQIHMSQVYPCGYCGLEFSQRGALLAHVVHHDKLKPFKCLFCEKGYTTHGDLQRHMVNYTKQPKLVGTKKLTFCDYCCKDFPNHNALVKHFQIHLPLSPFECAVCQEKFSSFRQMYNHKSKKTHFTDSDIIDGKMDLQAPGRKFRRYKVPKRKTEIDKERRGNNNVESGTDCSRDSIVNDVTNNKNIIEIDIDGFSAETDERAKEVLEEFENDVIRSMLDADSEVFDTVDFQSTTISASKEEQLKEHEEYKEETVLQDSYHYEIPEQNSYQNNIITVLDSYEISKNNSYISTDQPSENKSLDDNIDDLASAVYSNVQQQQQVVPGKTQTFQASDGSIIHVCVIKPDR